ncbi:alpha/beta fold hydrolase [Bradyrhizobium ontarionense]|uniref:Alpha/beta fold hydrolase n=1 Tax=Bradyrhizobium ontarionense TaxID=2898149 RepID=A0ABY3R838_9BRAD|nr:alpha/beta hydrolase [Bradyrhizobium sp. A19]UFZ03119.1 alpha/beta fold hydrolase [Bradyrhizobium sp. A19]
MRRISLIATGSWLLAFASLALAQAPVRLPTVAAERAFFYVGGRYVGEPGKELMRGQMYVEYLAPKTITQKYPLVLIHGAMQTATNWMMTPDGREGWAEYFLEQGYAVYLVDQPARGRSAWHPNVDGALRNFTASQLERQFTASERFNQWPQATKHTQWPGSGEGKGRMGDPIFDAFYATQVDSLASDEETQSLMQSAGAALLDRIGPAILLTHSQAGPLGWAIAEARPALVKAIVAVEPSGPPFENAVTSTNKARAWGVTDIPMTYDPPISAASELRTVKQPQPDAPDLTACILQAEPARKLKNLMGRPTLVVTAEASYHAVYDQCTAGYLEQAGVSVQTMRLGDRGIHGNGHMVMLELNNLDIAAALAAWLRENVK